MFSFILSKENRLILESVHESNKSLFRSFKTLITYLTKLLLASISSETFWTSLWWIEIHAVRNTNMIDTTTGGDKQERNDHGQLDLELRTNMHRW